MSRAAILAGLAAANEAEVARVRAEADRQVAEIEARAEQTTRTLDEVAGRQARVPASRERARMLHTVRLEELRLVGNTRQALIDAALAETQRQLALARQKPDYAERLCRFMTEALAALGEAEDAAGLPRVCVDPHDEAAVRAFLAASGLAPRAAVEASFETWGGVIVQSGDGRITIDNRLEARLERASVWLKPRLAAFFEQAASAAETAADRPRQVAGDAA